jgi:hypothetical protein
LVPELPPEITSPIGEMLHQSDSVDGKSDAVDGYSIEKENSSDEVGSRTDKLDNMVRKVLIVVSNQKEPKFNQPKVTNMEDLLQCFRDIDTRNYYMEKNALIDLLQIVEKKVVFYEVLYGSLPSISPNSDEPAKICRASVYLQSSKKLGDLYSLYWFDPSSPDNWLIEVQSENNYNHLIDKG